ncbi:Ribonuclease H [Actinomadura rubteroloni]|uniref:Ribonuclease H n=1 Tax=Actinomadura rubteroloni TaxID=1926885 RepID=A0A2P4UED5_9ACTN|nr:RNase H family protein [Actinomadura rubteroloni]POM23396.1 Ribonuclease H [Actinomadura rubteroloni]
MTTTTMSLHRFESGLLLLPPRTADRARRMRAAATRAQACPTCAAARTSLDLCFIAARYNDPAWVETALAEAEHHVDSGRHHPRCPQSPERPPARPAPRAGHHGSLAEWARRPGPTVAATDASCKNRRCGLGYVVSDGRWGMHGCVSGPGEPAGPGNVLVSELKAVALLLDRLEDDGPLTLLVDSLAALRLLRRWRSGDVEPMPKGYAPHDRRSGGPALVRLAESVAARPRLGLHHVKGHAGHPLNETADSLASIARRRLTTAFDATTRAEELVRAFLADWHDHAAHHSPAA